MLVMNVLHLTHGTMTADGNTEETDADQDPEAMIEEEDQEPDLLEEVEADHETMTETGIRKNSDHLELSN